MEHYLPPNSSSQLPEKRVLFDILSMVRNDKLTSEEFLKILGENPRIDIFELFDSVANQPGYYKCARDMVGALLEHISGKTLWIRYKDQECSVAELIGLWISLNRKIQ